MLAKRASDCYIATLRFALSAPSISPKANPGKGRDSRIRERKREREEGREKNFFLFLFQPDLKLSLFIFFIVPVPVRSDPNGICEARFKGPIVTPSPSPSALSFLPFLRCAVLRFHASGAKRCGEFRSRELNSRPRQCVSPCAARLANVHAREREREYRECL